MAPHPLGDNLVTAMNALHALMAESDDPAVVQTSAQCLQALAKLQSTAFQQQGQQSQAVQSVLSQLGAQQ